MSELPEGWAVCTTEAIATTSSGGTPSRTNKSYYSGPIPWLKSGELNDGIVTQIEESISEEGLANSSAKLFPKGSLLIAMYGATVGKLGILGIDSTTNQAICAIKNSVQVDTKYLFYHFLRSRDALIKLGQGGAQPNINQEIIKTFRLPLAPFSEQKRIVEKIEELFSQIDAGEAALKKAQALIKQYRQSLLKAAVTGELTKEWREKNKGKIEPADKLLTRILAERRKAFNGRGKYAEPCQLQPLDYLDLPQGWTQATVDQLSSLVQYGTSAKCNGDTKGVAVLRMGNLQFGSIDMTNLKYLPKKHDEFPALLLDDGDLLFNRTNSAELVGKTAVYTENMGSASFASYLIRVKLPMVEPRYVAYFINSAYGRKWISEVASQQVGQANVNGSKLKALTIPLPSLEEQRIIVETCEEKTVLIDHLFAELEKKSILSATLRQSILKSAFSGQLVPQDPTDEPASILLERIKAERTNALLGRIKDNQNRLLDKIDRINSALLADIRQPKKKRASK